MEKNIIYSIQYFRRRQWHPTPVLLPGKSHGQRSLVGCSPWSRWELDTTQWLHFHLSLSYTGEGNGSPLQCSCLENPRDSRAWWAAVCGVTQSRTWLKPLSSSSSIQYFSIFIHRDLPSDSLVKNLSASTGDSGDMISIPRSGRSPGGENGIHSSILSLKISWTREPSGLLSRGLKESATIEHIHHAGVCHPL